MEKGYTERELNITADELIIAAFAFDRELYNKPGQLVSKMKRTMPAIDGLKARHFDILKKGDLHK